MPSAVGDFLIIRAARATGGGAIAVEDNDILAAVDDVATQDGLLLSPEGGSGLAAYRQALARGMVRSDERVVLFNGAVGVKYPMPAADGWLDLHGDIDLADLDF